MITKRWTRSPRGKVFGVAAGLAEWRDLPVQTVQALVFLIILFTGFFPGACIYLILALILPSQTQADILDSTVRKDFKSRGYSYCGSKYQEAEYEEHSSKSEKSTEDLKKEYEELKKKVESMEGQMFDKEKDWDQRFNEDKNDK